MASTPSPTSGSAESPSGDPWRAFGYITAGVMVYGLVGWGLDRWLGTWPWLFLVFFVLGSVAGVLNVYRLFNPRARSRAK